MDFFLIDRNYIYNSSYIESTNSMNLHGLNTDFPVAVELYHNITFTYMENWLFLLCKVLTIITIIIINVSLLILIDYWLNDWKINVNINSKMLLWGFIRAMKIATCSIAERIYITLFLQSMLASSIPTWHTKESILLFISKSCEFCKLKTHNICQLIIKKILQCSLSS